MVSFFQYLFLSLILRIVSAALDGLIGNQNQLLHKMQQGPKCGFLFCSREERSLEESAQEALSSNYSQEMGLKIQKTSDRGQAHSPQPKEIFSFKHNCFRNFPNSDKHHLISANQPKKLPETVNHLQNCRSTSRKLLRLAQSPPPNNQSQRLFCSPPPRTEFKPMRASQSPQIKTSMILPSNSLQQPIKVTFNNRNDAYYNSHAGRSSKNSEQTHYSFQKSEANQPTTPASSTLPRSLKFYNQNQNDLCDQWLIKTDKCIVKKPSIQTHEGGETQRTLIDYLNEDVSQMNKHVEGHNQPFKDNFTPWNLGRQVTPMNYAPFRQGFQATTTLKNHHHTAIIRSMMQTSNLNTCKVQI